MKTISLRIDEALKERWDRLAGEHGLNQSHLMREAIAEKLEELEDFYTVRARLGENFTPVSNEDVWNTIDRGDLQSR